MELDSLLALFLAFFFPNNAARVGLLSLYRPPAVNLFLRESPHYAVTLQA